MRLILCGIGRFKAGPERDLFDRYVTRAKALTRSVGFTGLESVETDEAKARSPDARKRDEAAGLSAKLAGDTRLFVFDETGRSFTSQDFVDDIVRARDDRVPALGLVIGGPDGIDPGLRARATRVLAFGAATMPHQIVRVLVAEQVYRALTILSHHPYHRL